ncbi:hypothetical protein QKU48_gp0800 [Fadolivirus algeromassiliense]|jgi:hypothetical protein|uniref:Uncharacterized protein n=1 Tax=Fadolivirus FV1/VV64 TaxID=3070911 RepID=A0A7D3R271_9VIRU|nr:hypothetical protein QKU48_gp0800 [Fadolivirus algeromassiliense]QKF94258.1 hypothetical protein Fadolivirus_1_800 [Fadolivirus FV1/VV64]
MSLFGQKSFDIRSNGVYVIIEVEPSVPFNENTFRVVGASHSLEIAKQYAGPNRIIKGPVPLFDSVPPQPKSVEPFGNPFRPDEIYNPKPFIFNPPEPAKPNIPFFPEFHKPSFPQFQLNQNNQQKNQNAFNFQQPQQNPFQFSQTPGKKPLSSNYDPMDLDN